MNESDDKFQLDATTVERLLTAGEPLDPPEDARARMRARLMRQSRVHVPLASGRMQLTDAQLPDALISVRPDETSDWQSIIPGLFKRILFQADGCEAFLLRLDAGATVPAHTHEADEECVVIDGQITIAGVDLPKGSFHLAPAGVPHGDITSETGALLFIKTGHFRAAV